MVMLSSPQGDDSVIMSGFLLELYGTGVVQGSLYGVIDRDVESVERFVAEF